MVAGGNYRRVTSVILALFMCGACGPKVMSFKASPCTTITREDSIRFSWQVRGKTQLTFHAEDVGDDGNPGKTYLMYKLVASKGGKEAASPNLGVTLVSDTVIDNIFINTKRVGDSVVASDSKDTLVWGTHFQLQTVASLSSRPVTVVHGGRIVELDAGGDVSTGLQGLVNSGPWVIRSLLTGEEKRDTTLIPGRLMLKTVVIHVKN